MNKNTNIIILIFISICTLFIIDKRIFNKELILAPYEAWKDHLEYLRTVNLMKERIIREVPRILNINTTDFERLNLIREWTHEQTVWGKKQVGARLRESVNDRTGPQMYNYISSTNKALDCGSYSVFLLKVYQLFGYESFIYDMGRDNQFKHSVVLVWIKSKGKNILVVEDPSYNLTFVKTDNTPIDFFEFLKQIKEKKQSSFYIKQSLGKGHKTICFPDDMCDLAGKNIEKRDMSGVIVFRDHFDPQIIKDNMQSFLYYRYIHYFMKEKNSFSIIKPIETLLLKIKLYPIIGIIK